MTCQSDCRLVQPFSERSWRRSKERMVPSLGSSAEGIGQRLCLGDGRRSMGPVRFRMALMEAEKWETSGRGGTSGSVGLSQTKILAEPSHDSFASHLPTISEHRGTCSPPRLSQQVSKGSAALKQLLSAFFLRFSLLDPLGLKMEGRACFSIALRYENGCKKAILS